MIFKRHRNHHWCWFWAISATLLSIDWLITKIWKGLNFIFLWVAFVFKLWVTFLTFKVLPKINANRVFWFMALTCCLENRYQQEKICQPCSSYWRTKWWVKWILYSFLFLVFFCSNNISRIYFWTLENTKLLILYSICILMWKRPRYHSWWCSFEANFWGLWINVIQ